ncbi:MAG TPA: hypothetical protein VGS19_02075 [Streptosporangiaceae bacterium]|nr:hypothetical protein [Streptosporangiaceae bacterium]
MTAEDQLAAAEREAEISRQRLRDTHEHVVKPLRAAAAENNFARIISAAFRGEGSR